jgi:hypothetical protein
MPAATADPKATNNSSRVGGVEVVPDRPLARGVDLDALGDIEVLHRRHHLASRFGQLGVGPGIESDRDERGAAVRRDQGGLGRRAQRVDDRGGAGAAGERGDHRGEDGGVLDDRFVLAVHDDRRLRSELGEVAAQLVADLLGRRTLCLPTGTRERPGEGGGERCCRHDDDEPQDHHPLRSAGGGPAQSGQPALAVVVGSGRARSLVDQVHRYSFRVGARRVGGRVASGGERSAVDTTTGRAAVGWLRRAW